MSDPVIDQPLWSLPATRIAALVKSRALSARSVTEACLARVEAVNPAINAIVDYQPENSLAAADAVDAMVAAGRDPGILAGVPVTIKVNVDQEGHATTNGLKAQKDLIATSNNPVVESLLSQGAVSLGRTNTPAFSYRWFTNNLVHGHTYNPRNRALTPGGSSGGAGASVAAGLGAIGHGTDIAGSVRYPAYACGVHGLRPSLGRVAALNRSGADRTIGGQIMAVSGPLARSVGDLRLALQAMARPDACDPWWVPAPLVGPAVAKRAALCIAPDGMETAPELEAALREAAAKLRDAGWQVDELDALPPIREAVAVQLTLWMGDGYEALVAEAEAEGDPGAIAALGGQRAFVETLAPDSLPKALTTRVAIARAWQLFTEQYPVVLLPPCAELPFADNLDLKDEASYGRVWRAQMPMIGLPVTGLPSLTLTTGMTGDSVPVGIQIVAGKYREDVALEAAEAIEARGDPVQIATP
ncbi:amidase family protein [Pseudooceanicola sp. CBS1P-1]|uniref:Amidase n=1 Tax=Pseudooceanicola albus TaxID=2692189 RepID=A0A6L7G1P0_9RHOB|nr:MULTISPECIES: amidase family protein [Pseudooceanicola]MBT9383520.1 amidase family protein [Pseudooceanicola endophyticus]MXN17376.1 amidase [Pseudooceanicola albus]